VLQVRGLTVAFGRQPILEGIDLDVKRGQFTSLIGPSGSGKTSILRAVAGILSPERGTVNLEVPLNDVGFLFQDDALLPWRTVRQNVALGLRIRGIAADIAAEKAERWLSLLGLEGLGDRYPRKLSGGQRKRVAIAQVLVLQPKLLLMDEPFASLDAIVRTRITQELLGWVEREHLTVLLVTHDLHEAISVSDVVYVLSQGPRATIRARHDVTIARPRSVLETRSDPLFAPMFERLWNELSS
jgi:NitT/TauT family transport system ATP-binding protein